MVSGNRHKCEEIKKIFSSLNVEFVSLKDYPPIDIVEDGKTFLENALIKAMTAAKRFNVVALGEDSGLIVDILGGKPGVYSRRFAGENATDEDNNKLLLSLLREIPFEERRARFVSTAVVSKPDGSYIYAEGNVEGLICDEPRGKNGFGYDPIFYYLPLKKTFAELSDDEKNSISHRKNALENLRPELIRFLNL